MPWTTIWAELDRPTPTRWRRGASDGAQENYGGTDQRLGNLRPELAAQVDADELTKTPMPTWTQARPARVAGLREAASAIRS